MLKPEIADDIETLVILTRKMCEALEGFHDFGALVAATHRIEAWLATYSPKS